MNNFGIDVIETKLKSGLKTILLKTPGYKSKCAYMVAPIGSRIHPLRIDGVDIPTGIAHFLEHRLFDTKYGDAFELLSRIGCDSNAFTTYDFTCYYFNCTENLLEGIQILFEMTTNLSFGSEQVENEKSIIVQEKKMKRDHPSSRLSEGLLENLFVNDGLNTEIIGNEKDINSTTLEHLKLVFESFYNVNELTLIVVGDLDNKFISKLNRLKINNQVYDHKVEFKKIEEPKEVNIDYRHTSMDIPVPMVNVGAKLPLSIREKFKMNLTEFNALLLITESLLFSDSGKLCKSLREKEVTQTSVLGGFINCKDYAIMTIETSTKNPNPFIKEIKWFFNNMEKYISKDIFERTKKYLLGVSISNLSLPDSVGMSYIFDYGISSNLFERMNAFTSIKYKDVLKLINEMKLVIPSVHVISKKGI